MNRGALVAIAVALLVAGIVSLSKAGRSVPPVGDYAAVAIVQVTRPSLDGPSASEALRAECSILESTALLDGVISNLNLTAKWSSPDGQTSPSDVRERLRSSLEVKPNQDSEQITVRVAGIGKQETEEMAQSVLRVYDELRRTKLKRSKPKNIVSLEEQLDELEPKLRLALETMEKVGRELTVADVYTPPRNEPTLLDRIREGKEEEPPDNSSTLYGNDPAPRNETPEQAKRRIYLRSRRVAEVLSLRKERLEARLDYERTRTSTSESPRAQVIQQPEAVHQGYTSRPASPPAKRGTMVGWSCIVASVLLLLRAVAGRKASTNPAN